MSPELAFRAEENHIAAGCVDHRGRITEEADYDEAPSRDTVAVTAKFGTRNPAPEREIRETLGHDDGRIALGHAAGPGLNFPDRAATTVANAKTRETFAAFESGLADALDAVGVDAPVYYLKGDAAMLSAPAMSTMPAHALRRVQAETDIDRVKERHGEYWDF
jgi:N-methylhydantoinase A/oxoprolinase/acetone carboxylase beta subunit